MTKSTAKPVSSSAPAAPRSASAIALARLDNLIRARRPVIVINSAEEARVEKIISALAKGQRTPKAVWAWSLSDGLRPALGRKIDLVKEFRPEDLREPAPALEFVRRWPANTGTYTPCIFVFKDIAPLITDASGNISPLPVRLLRDLAVEFQRSVAPEVSVEGAPEFTGTLILLNPSLRVPDILRKDVAIIDWPLPDEIEMDAVLSLAEGTLPDDFPVHLNGDRQAIIRAMGGLTEAEASAALRTAIAAERALTDAVIPHIIREKQRIIAESGALEFIPATGSMSNIGGLKIAKAYARKLMAAMSDEARAYGLDAPKGLMLVGAPGSGKSLMAKSLVEGRLPILRFDVGAAYGSLVGSTEENFRRALSIAEACAPCELWIDEIEKALGGSGGEMDGGTSLRALGTILTWMQEHTSPVFVVATANDVASLRPELLSRFNKIFYVDLPGLSARQEIIAIHLAKRGRVAEDYPVEHLAKLAAGFSGREIEAAIVEALWSAFDDQARDLSRADLTAALKSLVPVSRSMGEKLTALRGWAARNQVTLADEPDAEGVLGAETVAGIEQ